MVHLFKHTNHIWEAILKRKALVRFRSPAPKNQAIAQRNGGVVNNIEKISGKSCVCPKILVQIRSLLKKCFNSVNKRMVS